jgi:nucleotide-binding universal stress UspA family protein
MTADGTSVAAVDPAGMDAPLIAGFDGSTAATAAVGLTTQLAAALDAPLVVAHAFAPGHDIAESRAASDELLARVAEPHARKRSIAAHSPADGLRDVADYEGAALLAVGRTHHGIAGRPIDGVPSQLIHDAPCPVLVVPAGAATTIDVVGVAFDGREASRAALAFAEDLARRVGARIEVLTVDDEDATTQEHADHRTLHGRVGATLTDACQDGIDLLVTGSRARGPVATVVAGSVSRHLAHRAPCPVLVVPRGVKGLREAGRTVGAA